MVLTASVFFNLSSEFIQTRSAQSALYAHGFGRHRVVSRSCATYGRTPVVHALDHLVLTGSLKRQLPTAETKSSGPEIWLFSAAELLGRISSNGLVDLRCYGLFPVGIDCNYIFAGRQTGTVALTS